MPGGQGGHMLTTCDKRRNNYRRLHIRAFRFTSLQKLLIFSRTNIRPRCVPPSICCTEFCSPCNGVGPLADGCTASLLQILRGNEGEIIRSYLHTSHITGPTRPISTTSLSTLGENYTLDEKSSSWQEWLRVHVVVVGGWSLGRRWDNK